MTTLVGTKAPDFTAAAVLRDGEIIKNFNLHNHIANKPALLFFYPFDFTFVCPTELIALHKRMQLFKQRKIEVLAISIDSDHTHRAWRNTPVEQGGIGPVDFTLISDVKQEITQVYGVQHPEEGAAYRAAFLIDNDGMIRSSIVNDLPIGRNIDEILRLFDAIEFNQQHGQVCPVGWQQGDQGMQADDEGVIVYLTNHYNKL